jgi:CBS domain-containing protein
MTEAVVVIEVDRPVSEVLDCFAQYPIHHLPVVRDGKLAGMVSTADVLKLEFFLPRNDADRTTLLHERFPLDKLMHAPPVSVQAGTSILEAAERMTKAGVHALPVTDDTGRVVGIVTTTDVIRSLIHGPPRHGNVPARPHLQPLHEDTFKDAVSRLKPAPSEYATALDTATTLHVEERDPRHLGKALLYLDQRVRLLEKVLELADRFLLTGQDEHVHALLLRAIHAAKRAEEHATGQARVPFPLE